MELALAIFRHVSSLYFENISEFISRINPWLSSTVATSTGTPRRSKPVDAEEARLSHCLVTTVLCMKTQRRLMVHGFHGFHKIEDTTNFFSAILEQLKLIDLSKCCVLP